MACGIGQVLGEKGGPTLPERLELVRGIPPFFRRFFGSLTEYSAACDMFWDVVISYSNPSGETADAIFGALSDQLTIPNRCCQLSALHGFNHLRDRRCVPVITALERTIDDPRDPGVRAESEDVRRDVAPFAPLPTSHKMEVQPARAVARAGGVNR